MKHLCLSILLAGLGLAAFAQSGQNDLSILKTLEKENYTLKYLSTFDLDESGQMGTKFIIFAKLESPEDAFRENVNLIVQDLKGMDLNLDKYTQLSEEQVKTMVTNSKLIESKRIKTDKDEYHIINYTGDQGMYHLHFEQWYRVLNDKAYVLTFTAEQSQYERYQSFCETVMNSFRIKE